MLAGLRLFNLKKITIIGHGYDAFVSSIHQNGDVDVLASVLAHYNTTHMLRFKFESNTATTGLDMIRAFDSHTLPALMSVHVECAPLGDFDDGDWVPCYWSWFDALEAALERRKESGRRVELLYVSGRLCLCQFWGERVHALVATLQTDVTSTRGAGEVCVFCREAEDRPSLACICSRRLAHE